MTVYLEIVLTFFEFVQIRCDRIKKNLMNLMKKAVKKKFQQKGAVRDYPIPARDYSWKPGGDPQSPREIEKFFNSPKIEALKRLIVDLGRRSYGRSFNDGNGGNFTVRVGDNLVLCTPTMVSKGSMTPQDMCLVNLDGVQLAGRRRRTSEVLAHLAIMRRQKLAKACCHAHPPHATAFALAGLTPPRCANPETEIFIGQVAVADYDTPGTSSMAELVGEAGAEHDCVFMLNHGVMTWAGDVETALWKMENIEAHCRTCMLAAQLGGALQFGPEKAEQLIAMRDAMGFVRQPDCRAFKSGDKSLLWNMDAFVDAVAARVAEKLGKGKKR